MGTYTQFFFKAKLDLREHPDIARMLIEVRNRKDDSYEYPDHPFFKSERWLMLFHCGNWDDNVMGMRIYLVPGRQEIYELRIESEFKCYDNEIEKFVDWIYPYVAGRKKKQYVGWFFPEFWDHRNNIYILRNQEEKYSLYR